MSQTVWFPGLGRWSQRLGITVFLGGQVLLHSVRGKLNPRHTLDQMAVVGPGSLVVVLLTGAFVGMVFTIQVAREFIRFGTPNLVGGVLALSLARELAPVLTAVIAAGRVSSAFAAEIGTMQVTEQIDALYMLRTDPVDYLVLPRVVACSLMLPVLTLLALVIGLGGGLLVANQLYGISTPQFLNSVQNFLEPWDVISPLIKAVIFGGLIGVIGCGWGLTTQGGAKGVGQSTTSAVVTALLITFVMDFFLSWAMFQGLGGSLGKGF